MENVSRSHCPVCLGDIHTSRIPCHIPDCGHLLHRMCFDQLLASGHYTCPTCQTSLIDMTALWEYLDAQAVRMPVPLMYENQRVHIFCNDCHKVGLPLPIHPNCCNVSRLFDRLQKPNSILSDSGAYTAVPTIPRRMSSVVCPLSRMNHRLPDIRFFHVAFGF